MSENTVAPTGTRSVPRIGMIDRILLWTVIAHFLIAGSHAVMHLGASVALTLPQLAFIAIVIVAAPLYGTYLHFTKPGPAGAVITTLSMLGSLIFGFVFHFVADTPDNIGHTHEDVIGAWAPAFDSSAVAVMVVEVLGTLLAVVALSRRLAARTS